MKIHVSTFFFVILLGSCSEISQNQPTQTSEMETWKLSWRMIESSWNHQFELVAAQFDSLLETGTPLKRTFLLTGLEALYELDQKEKLIQIFNQQDSTMQRDLCLSTLFAIHNDLQVCQGITHEPPMSHPNLQYSIIKLFVDDQAARGNLMEDIIQKYRVPIDSIATDDAIAVDAQNRDRLKTIINHYGFPTAKMVGPDAMYGLFLIIQHADNDAEWQKDQVANVEAAVKTGDMDSQDYAYLYDRVQINSGKEQLYGTQFSRVDRDKSIAILAPVEDPDHLDQRRMEMGMMPIAMYKKVMLEGF